MVKSEDNIQLFILQSKKNKIAELDALLKESPDLLDQTIEDLDDYEHNEKYGELTSPLKLGEYILAFTEHMEVFNFVLEKLTPKQLQTFLYAKFNLETGESTSVIHGAHLVAALFNKDKTIALFTKINFNDNDKHPFYLQEKNNLRIPIQIACRYNPDKTIWWLYLDKTQNKKLQILTRAASLWNLLHFAASYSNKNDDLSSLVDYVDERIIDAIQTSENDYTLNLFQMIVARKSLHDMDLFKKIISKFKRHSYQKELLTYIFKNKNNNKKTVYELSKESGIKPEFANYLLSLIDFESIAELTIAFPAIKLDILNNTAFLNEQSITSLCNIIALNDYNYFEQLVLQLIVKLKARYHISLPEGSHDKQYDIKQNSSGLIPKTFSAALNKKISQAGEAVNMQKRIERIIHHKDFSFFIVAQYLPESQLRASHVVSSGHYNQNWICYRMFLLESLFDLESQVNSTGMLSEEIEAEVNTIESLTKPSSFKKSPVNELCNAILILHSNQIDNPKINSKSINDCIQNLINYKNGDVFEIKYLLSMCYSYGKGVGKSPHQAAKLHLQIYNDLKQKSDQHYFRSAKEKILNKLTHHIDNNATVEEKALKLITYCEMMLAENNFDECRKQLQFLRQNFNTSATVAVIAKNYHLLSLEKNNSKKSEDFANALELEYGPSYLMNAKTHLLGGKHSNYILALKMYLNAITTTNEPQVTEGLKAFQECLGKGNRAETISLCQKLITHIYINLSAFKSQSSWQNYRSCLENIFKTYQYLPAHAVIIRADNEDINYLNTLLRYIYEYYYPNIHEQEKAQTIQHLEHMFNDVSKAPLSQNIKQACLATIAFLMTPPTDVDKLKSACETGREYVKTFLQTLIDRHYHHKTSERAKNLITIILNESKQSREPISSQPINDTAEETERLYPLLDLKSELTSPITIPNSFRYNDTDLPHPLFETSKSLPTSKQDHEEMLMSSVAHQLNQVISDLTNAQEQLTHYQHANTALSIELKNSQNANDYLAQQNERLQTRLRIHNGHHRISIFARHFVPSDTPEASKDPSFGLN